MVPGRLSINLFVVTCQVFYSMKTNTRKRFVDFSGCECMGHANSPRMAAMGDAAASNTAGEHNRRRQQHNQPQSMMSERSKLKEMQHKMMTCSTFDAQEWLEKKKRLNRCGTYKFYNKSEVKMGHVTLYWVDNFKQLRSNNLLISSSNPPKCFRNFLHEPQFSNIEFEIDLIILSFNIFSTVFPIF